MDPIKFSIKYWQLIWYAVILVLGVVGNVIVLFVLVRSKRIQKSSPFNVFLLSLAVTDLLISLVGLPTYVLSTDTFKHPEGKVGNILCKFITGDTLSFFFLDMSTFLMVVIYIERWKAIRKPFSVLDSKPLWQSVGVVGVVVLVNVALSSPTVYGIVYNNNRPAGGNFCANSYGAIESLVIYLSIFVFDTVIPISIIVTLCIRIAIYLHKTKVQLETLRQDQTSNKRSSLLGDRKKTIHTLTLVVLAFSMCVVPNHIIFLLSLTEVIHWNTAISQVAVLLRFSNSFINPFLYSYSSHTFRSHCKEVFSCCACCHNTQSQQQHGKYAVFYKDRKKHKDCTTNNSSDKSNSTSNGMVKTDLKKTSPYMI